MGSGLVESKQQIRKEIPQRGATNGENLADIEIPFELVGEEPQHQRIDSQAYRRDNHERAVFGRDILVGTLKRPQPVQDIIGGRRADKTQRIAHIFVDFRLLLEKICDAEIHKQPGKTDDCIFQEFINQQFVYCHDSCKVIKFVKL